MNTNNKEYLKLTASIMLLAVLYFTYSCANEKTYFTPPPVIPEVKKEKPPLVDGYNPEGEQDSSYLPFGENGSLGGYQRLIPDDLWHPSAAIIGRAFDLLTPTGKLLFQKTAQYIKDQKKPEFQDYAQPLRCTTNLTHVLNSAGYRFQGNALHDVPHLLKAIQQIGGVVYDVPKFHKSKNNRHEIIDFFNTTFPQGIPTGTIIAGCSAANCFNSKSDGAHIAILGDKNEFGELMIYHNNWLRPNNLMGERIPYMVSLQNLYVDKRPREWMPTPWVYFLKDNQGTIQDMVSILPELDDLDPLNEKFHIKMALLPEIHQELYKSRFLPHHRHLTTANPHINFLIGEKKWEVCRSNKPLKEQDVRLSAAGEPNTYILEELSNYPKKKTFLDYRFEFAPIEQEEEWISALVYDAGRYWGQGDTYGAIWLHESQVTCKDKGTTH